jgi:hypothetical protein
MRPLVRPGNQIRLPWALCQLEFHIFMFVSIMHALKNRHVTGARRSEWCQKSSPTTLVNRSCVASHQEFFLSLYCTIKGRIQLKTLRSLSSEQRKKFSCPLSCVLRVRWHPSSPGPLTGVPTRSVPNRASKLILAYTNTEEIWLRIQTHGLAWYAWEEQCCAQEAVRANR